MFVTEPVAAAGYAAASTMPGHAHLVHPKGIGPFQPPLVLVIALNRAYSEELGALESRARWPRASGAGAGRLFPVGGYPGNDDDGRALQAELDQGKLTHRHAEQRKIR